VGSQRGERYQGGSVELWIGLARPLDVFEAEDGLLVRVERQPGELPLVVGLDDYSGWLTAWLGRDAGDRAKEAFQRLDLDGDGYISAEEMRSIIAQYILSNDSNAPGNWLFG
jgi:hypothetical protein